jgi:hypothetical protein
MHVLVCFKVALNVQEIKLLVKERENTLVEALSEWKREREKEVFYTLKFK